MKVQFQGRDSQGRVMISRKALLPSPAGEEEASVSELQTMTSEEQSTTEGNNNGPKVSTLFERKRVTESE